MWLAPVSKASLEEALFWFLKTITARQPRSARLVLVENATLRALYASPHPLLEQALHHCVDSLLVDMSLDPKKWGKLEVPTWMLGVALALNNCLADTQSDGSGFTAALIEQLPASRQRAEILANHALLQNALTTRSKKTRRFATNLQALVERSPLTALWCLDEHTPMSLVNLARELVPGFRPELEIKSVWGDDEWLSTISSLLEDQDIARIVRQRWLVMPESRRACRNVGLVLEALRRRGHREFCLEFYEAYDYFRSELVDAWSGKVRVWPLLKRIEELLRVPGDSEAALRVNRWGNEYFLKFRALMEILFAEQGVPQDYKLLTLEFAQSMQPLAPYVTKSQSAISFGEVTFQSQQQ